MQDLKEAEVAQKVLADRRAQLVADHKTCTLVMRTDEKAAAVDGLNRAARQIPLWLKRVESFLRWCRRPTAPPKG
jgi:hypothetical protein